MVPHNFESLLAGGEETLRFFEIRIQRVGLGYTALRMH